MPKISESMDSSIGLATILVAGEQDAQVLGHGRRVAPTGVPVAGDRAVLQDAGR